MHTPNTKRSTNHDAICITDLAVPAGLLSSVLAAALLGRSVDVSIRPGVMALVPSLWESIPNAVPRVVLLRCIAWAVGTDEDVDVANIDCPQA